MIEILKGLALYVWNILAAWIAVIIGINTNIEDIVALHRRGKNAWQRYGSVAILVLRGSLESYYQMEHVLDGDDDEILSFQQSAIMECNMVAVAAAIISSVTITTYQLPEALDMFWAVPAAFTFSLITSLFSVYGACTLQRQVANLSSAAQLRAWLSAPRDKGSLNCMEDEDSPRANVATVLTFTAPRTLLDHSIRFFMVGLAGYLVCLHTFSKKIIPDPSTTMPTAGSSLIGSRNVIIVCSFSLCIGISLLISPSSYKNFKFAIVRRNEVFGPFSQQGLGFDRRDTSRTLTEKHEKHENHEKRPGLSALEVPRSLSDESLRVDYNNDVGKDMALVQVLKEAMAAHEKSAKAARESASADEKVALAYKNLIAAYGNGTS